MNRSVVRLASALAVLGLAGHARADAAAQARFHDDLARKAYEHAHDRQALEEFFLEQRLAPNPHTTFNIALCFEQLKRSEDAYQSFGEYLASDDKDAGRRDYATKALSRLEQKVARVNVTSDPPGARIYVDEREFGDYGTTPRAIAIAPGKHKVWVERAGYHKAGRTINVKAGKLVQAKLAPVRITGKLHVEAPVAAAVDVTTPDGVVVATGKTPFDATLSPGAYQVVVRAKGYQPAKSVASVSEGKTTTRTAALSRLPAATGDVTVTSNVAGAIVTLDGQRAGFTPTVLPRLGTGTHQLHVEGQGLLPWTGVVPVHEDERSWVTVSLESPARTTRSPVTWVTGGVGVALLVAGGVVGAMAISNHNDFENAPSGTDRTTLVDRGHSLNTATTVLLVGGVAVTGAATALYFLTAHNEERPSSATVSRGAR